MKRDSREMTAEEFALWLPCALRNISDVVTETAFCNAEESAEILEGFTSEAIFRAGQINPQVYEPDPTYPNGTQVVLSREVDHTIQETVRLPWDSEGLGDYFKPNLGVVS